MADFGLLLRRAGPVFAWTVVILSGFLLFTLIVLECIALADTGGRGPFRPMPGYSVETEPPVLAALTQAAIRCARCLDGCVKSNQNYKGSPCHVKCFWQFEMTRKQLMGE